jgi:hypothetical protein
MHGRSTKIHKQVKVLKSSYIKNNDNIVSWNNYYIEELKENLNINIQ